MNPLDTKVKKEQGKKWKIYRRSFYNFVNTMRKQKEEGFLEGGLKHGSVKFIPAKKPFNPSDN